MASLKMSSMKTPTSIRLGGRTSDLDVLPKLQRAFKDFDHITFLIGQYHPSMDVKFDEDAIFSVVREALRNTTVLVDNEVLGRPAVAVPAHSMVMPRQIGAEGKMVVDVEQPIRQFQAPEMRWEIPSHLIHRIMFQITCQALHAEDADGLQHSAFKLVVEYSWLRKTLAILAAFTLHYADYWYWEQSFPSDHHAQQISALEGSRVMKAKIEKDPRIKNSITLLNELVKDLLEMIGLIYELTDLCSKHQEREVPALNSVFNRLPEWNCQAVICIVAVNYQFTRFINAEEDRWPEWELIQLTTDVTSLIRELTAYRQQCRKDIEKHSRYMQYVKDMENPSSVVDVIKKLHRPDVETLLYGTTRKLVPMESLRNKDVLVVISPLKIAADDFEHLANVYTHFEHFPKLAVGERRLTEDTFQILPYEHDTTKNFEMIWIPFLQDFVDPQCPFSLPPAASSLKLMRPEDEVDTKLRALQSKMAWLMTEDPSQLHEYAERYMKEEWYYRGDIIVVGLNQSGRVECLNVMPRIRIWGTKAFPYELTINLWRYSPNWIQAVFDPYQENKFPPGKDTLILGGENLMSKISDQEMARIERATEFNILRVTDPLIFKRLENLLICRMQYLIERTSLNEQQPSDLVFDELSDAYTAYEKGGVAILTRGPDNLIFIEHGEPALKILSDYDTRLKKEADLKRFFQSNRRCKNIFLPSMGWWRQDWMRCRKSGEDMKYIENYKCCEE